MNRQEIIENYFSAWICQDRAQFDEIFSDEVEYSECYGPEYHGLGQVKQWFENQIAEIVSRYEKMSRTFCESCGSDKAELRTERPYFRWVSTLCEECKNKRIRSYNERVIEKDELID